MWIDSDNGIHMIRGDSETIIVTCSDNGDVVPFAEGDTIYFTVKEDVDCTAKKLQKIITEFEENGRAIIPINPIDTKDLKFMDYVYDIQFNRADGRVSTIVYPSTFEICGEVTYE